MLGWLILWYEMARRVSSCLFPLAFFRWIAWRLIRAEPISDIVFAVTVGILFMAFTPKLLSE